MWDSLVDRQIGFLNITKELASACRQARVTVFGTGGNGAIIDHLVRVGFERFEICDFDLVDKTNLNRLPFTMTEIGLPKVEAWEKYLKAINPACQVRIHKREITHKDCDLVSDILQRTDIVALGTTSPEANLVISRLCYQNQKRMVVGPASSGSLVVSTFTHQNNITLEKLGNFKTENVALDQIDYQALRPLYARLVTYPGRLDKIPADIREKVAKGELEARSCKIFVSLTNAAMCWEVVKNVAVMNHLPLDNTNVVEMPVMQVFDPYRGAAYYWNYLSREIGIPNWLTGHIQWQAWKS